MGYGYGQYTPYTMTPGSRASSMPHPQSSIPSSNHGNSTAATIPTTTATATIPTASKQFQSSSHNITFDTDSSDDEELEQELNLNYQPDSVDLYANNLKMSINPTTYQK